MALTFKGGVYIPQNKNTQAKETRIFGSPKTVCIPVPESCTPTVKKGDRVDIGQVIGEVAGGMGCPVHASISGTVTAVENKENIDYITIGNDGEERISTDVKPYDGSFDDLSFEDIVDTVRRAGIPAYKDIQEAKGKADTLIVNCVESEPYLIATHRLLVEELDSVLGGMKILLKALGLRTADIAIDDNKPDTVRIIREKTKDGGYADIKVVKSKYPQTDDRVLVYAVADREISAGKAAVDVGCAVFDARTCADIYNAFVYGMPLIRCSVTVDGDCVKEPCCVRCPIGTSFSELIDFCGGALSEIKYLINGDPMTGEAQGDIDTPVTKDSVAVLAFSDKLNPSYGQPSACIRCGRCVSACPMRLMPNYLAVFASEGRYDLCKKYDVMSCIECGVCSYVCPGNMPITQLNREAKERVNMNGGEE
ncbi:MAG: RnfABCDGE type electron transport complex subunit C [Clostridia bacterium]|nr:RnfABCDGE type electron transport complex subunit C [Clostridia bacterium]